MAAIGLQAYPLAMFHLWTHAAFKALLFLGCGAVIVALHHQQNGYQMGGLRWQLPGAYITMIIGVCSLSALPPLAGFYSKDAIIDAAALLAEQSTVHAAVYVLLLVGAAVTPAYGVRLLWLIFAGDWRGSKDMRLHRLSVRLLAPLWALAVPSVVLGVLLSGMLSAPGRLSGVYYADIPALDIVYAHLHHPWQYALHAPETVQFWLMVLGGLLGQQLTVWQLSSKQPVEQWQNGISRLLRVGYGFDYLVDALMCLAKKTARQCSSGEQRWIEQMVIEGVLTNRPLRIAKQAQAWRNGSLGRVVAQLISGMAVLLTVLVWSAW